MPGHALPQEFREVSIVQITDPTAVSDSIEVLNQDVIHLDTAGFEVKRVTVPLAECCLIYQWTNAALRTQTRVHDDFDACTILGPQASGSIDGVELSPYGMIVARTGAQREIVVNSGYESVALLAPPKVLQEHLTLRRLKVDFELPENVEVWHADKDVARNLFELGTRIVETAEKTPGTFNENHWARYGAQVEYMDSLFTTIESCDLSETAESDKKGKSYSKIVRKCESYTLNLDGRRPYLSELCETANVSERTLQYAFHDMMGMSPLTYLHRLRLHRARDELRGATSDSTTVTDVAMNWGFWHLGEFSRAYRNCFDEVPSSTLRRNPG
ncbi:MAG: hypothetical protein DRR11_17035 [Gammaproteobacteria bacterium]|nr:MAG: hypothetical protein DRR11_17035 [Gammaproteobacteria bacterium]